MPQLDHEMKYRRLGKTNLRVSVFSVGTMRSLASPQNFRATLLRAFSLGINHVETAQAYGQSELWLGELFRDMRQGLVDEGGKSFVQPIVTTKVLPTADRASMAEQIEQSLQRLQLDSLDCLALHGINTEQHLRWIKDPDG